MTLDCYCPNFGYREGSIIWWCHSYNMTFVIIIWLTNMAVWPSIAPKIHLAIITCLTFWANLRFHFPRTFNGWFGLSRQSADVSLYRFRHPTAGGNGKKSQQSHGIRSLSLSNSFLTLLTGSWHHPHLMPLLLGYTPYIEITFIKILRQELRSVKVPLQTSKNLGYGLRRSHY